VRAWWGVAVAAGVMSGQAWGQTPPTVPRLLAQSKITLSKAAIETGRLVIQGTTAAANTKVSLNGGLYSATSDSKKAFAFTLVWLPPDCVAKLTTASGTDQAVVAMCGPKGLEFRGTWLSATNYITNDLVTVDGATWRGKRANTNKRPGQSSADWEVFAAKGATGAAGAAAAAGGISGFHIVKKTCDDTTGWTRVLDQVYCIAQCQSGEVALSAGSITMVVRDTGETHGNIQPPLLGSSSDAALPQAAWFIHQSDQQFSSANPPKSESISRLTLSLACGAP
jgi:hypothetical protein